MARVGLGLVQRAVRSIRYRSGRAAMRYRSNRFAAACARAGDGVWLGAQCAITGTDRIELGDNVHIGDGAFIRAEGGLSIGSNTHISRNLVLYTMTHDYHGARLPYDEHQIRRAVHIGRNVWIGMNVCIAPGTTIGDGAIVALGAVVSGSVPAGAVVASQPWRQVSERDEEHYRRSDALGEYGGSGGHAYRPPDGSSVPPP